MYQEFMVTLAQNLDNKSCSIWTLSYIGHETSDPPLLPSGETVNVMVKWTSYQSYILEHVQCLLDPTVHESL